MKNALIFSLIIFNSFRTLAQVVQPQVSLPPCLQNSDFSQFCGTQAYSDCDNQVSFYEGTGICSPESVTNWHNSHGTPQLAVDNFNPVNNYASMFYNPAISKGEGIFAGFDFYSNTAYLIKVRMLKSEGTTGTFKLFAANNVPEPSVLPCSLEPIPSVLDETPINPNPPNYNNTSWQEYDFSYTPTNNTGSTSLKYSELWIYPFSSSPDKYGMYVDYVSVCPNCNGVIIYNTGSVPYGITRAGYIYAGSSAGSGGSGTVTINSSQQTTLYGYQAVELDPNFNATVLGTGSLTLDLLDCSFEAFAARSASKPSSAISEAGAKSQLLLIYPNPIHSILTLQLSTINEEWQSIKLLNGFGSVMKVINNTSKINTKSLNVDMTNLAQGIYYIQMQTKTKVFTQKVIKD